MADSKKKKTSSKSSTKYFRNKRASAERITVSQDENGTPKYVRFMPYWEMYQGDRVKVGYLETDNKKVIERCEANYAIEEIDAKEYKDATGKNSQRAPL